MDFNSLYLSRDVQVLVKRTCRHLSIEYANGGRQEADLYDELLNQSYIEVYELMQKYTDYLDTRDLVSRRMAYLTKCLPFKLKDYIWYTYGIKRTQDGYKVTAQLVEFDPVLHGETDIEPLSERLIRIQRQTEFEELVSPALQKLTLKQREVLDLEFYHSMPQSEVADTLGITPGAHRKRRHDAIAAMERILEKPEL